jgi:hypothetical protein
MPKKIIKTPLTAMIKEHQKLINVLKKGSSKQIKGEIADQSAELKKYLKMKSKK